MMDVVTLEHNPQVEKNMRKKVMSKALAALE